MFRFVNCRRAWALLVAGVVPHLFAQESPAAEMRGLWVESGPAGIKSAGEVAELVRVARAAHLNALFVEAVKLGQANYRSELLPPAPAAAGAFDPLAEVVRQAHDTKQGPRLEVHAWVSLLPVWNQRDTPPADRRHASREHPEWLTRDFRGTNFGLAYVLDPGHPAVADHLVAVAGELVSRYELDGLYLDDFWYPAGGTAEKAQSWGYNPVAVERYQKRFSRPTPPPPNEPAWEQFRRDQLTFLVRRIVGEMGIRRPALRLSAGCRADAGGVYPIVWESTRGYRHDLQDWRTWLREGTLDTAVPLMYFEARIHPADWRAWSDFLPANRYQRQVVVGLGAQLNSLTDTLALARSVRELTGRPGGVEGMVFASYSAPSADRKPADFFRSLVMTNQFETHSDPLFSSAVPVPGMPWKTRPNRVRMVGRAQVGGLALDGARVEVRGRVTRSITTDANGWFGAVDLPPGEFLLRVRPAETNRVDLVGVFTAVLGSTVRPELIAAGEDPDHDGYTNEDEITAGTDPRDPQSRLLLNATVLADRIVLRADPVLPNRRYLIEAAPASQGPWAPLTDSASLDGSEVTAPVPSPNNYYRVRVSY